MYTEEYERNIPKRSSTNKIVEEAMQRITTAVHKDFAKDFLKILDFASGHCCITSEQLCKEIGLSNRHFSALEEEIEYNHISSSRLSEEEMYI